MKKQIENEWDAPAHKQQKAGWLSDMRISIRIGIVFGLAVLTAAVMFALSVMSIRSSQAMQREKIEHMVVSSAEEYISASIENITAIAQSLYSNESLSSFLNKRYSSSAEYYDAYFQLRSNNSLSVAENRSISKFYIYTDNKTILQGGDIYPVSSIQNEEWYKYFNSLRRNMILYCDSVNRRLSLIQKLDYIKYVDGASGEAYLKIDFNTAMLDSYFDSLSFDGSMYVLSGGVVLYSNQNADPENIRITPEYYCVFKNYYAVELEYYAAADRQSLPEVMLSELPVLIGFILFLIAALVISFVIFRNLYLRTTRLCKAFTQGELTSLRKRVYAKDEIGKITALCVSMTDRMELMQRDNKKSAELLEKIRRSANSLFMDALNQDAGLRYTAYFSYMPTDDCMEFSQEAFSQNIPLSKELEMVLQLLPERKHFGSLECVKLPDDLYILPCSVLLMSEELMRQFLAESEDAKLNIRISMEDNSLVMRFSADVNIVSGSTTRRRFIRLQAAFEDRPEQTDFSYEPMHPFNTCIRIKQYYRTGVSLCFSESDTLDLTLRFDRSKLSEQAPKTKEGKNR